MSCCYINKYKIYIITQLHTLVLYETLNLHIYIVIWIISIKKILYLNIYVYILI